MTETSIIPGETLAAVESLAPTEEEKVCQKEFEPCYLCSKTGDTDLWMGVIEKGRTLPKIKTIKIIDTPYYRLIGVIGRKYPKEVQNGDTYDLFALRTCLEPYVFAIDESLQVSFGTRRVFRPRGGWKQERLLRPITESMRRRTEEEKMTSGSKQIKLKRKGRYVMRFSMDLIMAGRIIFPALDIARRIQRQVDRVIRRLRSYCLLLDPSMPILDETTALDLTMIKKGYPARYVDPQSGEPMIPDVGKSYNRDAYNVTVSGESVFVSEMISIIPYLCSQNPYTEGVFQKDLWIDCDPSRMKVYHGRLYVQITPPPELEQAIEQGWRPEGITSYARQYDILKLNVKRILEYLRSKNAVIIDNPGDPAIDAWELRLFIEEVWPGSKIRSNIYITDWFDSRISRDLRPLLRTQGEIISIRLPSVLPIDESITDEDWILLTDDRSEQERRRDLLRDLSSFSIPGETDKFSIHDEYLVFNAKSAREVRAIVDTTYRSWQNRNS